KLQAQLVHDRGQQDVIDRTTALGVARLELGRLVALPPESVAQLGDPLARVGATPAPESLLAEAERAHPELRALAAERFAALARGIEAAVRAAWALYAGAVTRARFFETRYVPSATQVESMAREGFAAGKTSLLPLIEAQRALLDSRLGQTEARFAVQAARADLEEASGVALSAP